jgi:hypothetical protein
MAEAGPVVSAVHIKPNGEAVQVQVDMTPKKNAIVGILGAVATVLGALPCKEQQKAPGCAGFLVGCVGT